MEIEKTSDYTLKVMESETKVQTYAYSYDGMIAAREGVIGELALYTAKANEQIARFDALIAECGKQGITSEKAATAALAESTSLETKP